MSKGAWELYYRYMQRVQSSQWRYTCTRRFETGVLDLPLSLSTILFWGGSQSNPQFADVASITLRHPSLSTIYMGSGDINSSPLGFQAGLAPSLALVYFLCLFVFRWSHYIVGCP